MNTLILPVPPSANEYWRHTVDRRTGKPIVYLTERAKIFRRVVAELAQLRGLTPSWKAAELEIRVDWFRSPNPVTKQFQGDTGNREKVLGDALKGVAYADDDTTARLDLNRWDCDPEHPRVVVRIRPRTAAAPLVVPGFVSAAEQAAFEVGQSQLQAARKQDRDQSKERRRRKQKSQATPKLKPAVYRPRTSR